MKWKFLSSNQTFIHLDYIHKRINHFSTDFSLISLPFDPLHPLFAISQISSARHELTHLRTFFETILHSRVQRLLCPASRNTHTASNFTSSRRRRPRNLDPRTRNDPFVSFSFTSVFVPLFLLVPFSRLLNAARKTRQDEAILAKINRIRIVASLFVVLAANSPPRYNRDPATLDSKRTCLTNLSRVLLTTGSIPRCSVLSTEHVMPLWIHKICFYENG